MPVTVTWRPGVAHCGLTDSMTTDSCRPGCDACRCACWLCACWARAAGPAPMPTASLPATAPASGAGLPAAVDFPDHLGRRDRVRSDDDRDVPVIHLVDAYREAAPWWQRQRRGKLIGRCDRLRQLDDFVPDTVLQQRAVHRE